MLAFDFQEGGMYRMRLSYNGQEPLAAAQDWAARLYRAKDWSAAERDTAGMEFR